MEQRTCPRCSTVFTPNRPKQSLCSTRCNGKVRAGEQYTKTPVFTCEHCGKMTPRREFRFKNGRVTGHNYRQRFCSRACGYAGRKWRPISEEGHVHSTGYIRVNLRGGKKAFKHTLVMSQMLGRPLHGGESVHHKNGDKTDNRPENLELWSRYQPPGQRVIDKVQFAIDMLLTYPAFATELGYEVEIRRNVEAAAHGG